MGLEDKSRRPKVVRKPASGSGSSSQAGARPGSPSFVSESTVGRILTYLKARGQLVEPPARWPHAERKPKVPGDLIQLDTPDVKLTSWFGFKHFTAQDTVSRSYPSAGAKNARDFLEKLIARTPCQATMWPGRPSRLMGEGF